MATLKEIFGVQPDTVTNEALELLEAAQLREQAAVATAEFLGSETARLQESMRELSLFIEDLNWIPINGWNRNTGFSLETIRDNADRLQALLASNPTIKKAINARIGYIWSKGVTFEGNDAAIKKLYANPRNQTILFDEIAQVTIEQTLATDGNMWVEKNIKTNECKIVPIEHLAGWIVDENDPSRVLYWLVRYSVVTKNFSNGVETAKHVEYLVPGHDNPKRTPLTIDGIKVDYSREMHHIAANRQSDWILGLPDILAAMFWVKAFKELNEAGTTYVKAQGKFATKVINPNSLGGPQAAAAIADAPRRDPISGEMMDVGGNVTVNGGLDYQLMGKMSGGVDFSAFDPVAGLVAAGLGIPLNVILGKSDKEESSLEQSVVNEMRMRQNLWTVFFRRLFGGKTPVEAKWPRIRQDSTYRQTQAIEISNKTNSLHRNELRALTLEAHEIEGDPNDLPPITEQPDVAFALEKHKLDLKLQKQVADDGAKAASTPEQGQDAGIGKLSTGSDAHDARDAGEQEHTKE